MTDRPTCPLCCKPLANQADFDTVPENEGQHLCWADFGECECVGQETEIIAELRAENETLRKQVKLLHDATIVLRKGMGGHNHWDYTMQHGAGCEACIAQRKAKSQATELIEKAAAEAAKEHP